MNPSENLLKEIYGAHVNSHKSMLYEGELHTIRVAPNRDHPFFQDKWSIGSLVYKGLQFDSVKLMYDLYMDKLYINSPYISSSDGILLNNDLIDSFSFGSQQFFHTSLGFCEIIYSGTDLRVYRKHRKIQDFRNKRIVYVLEEKLYLKYGNSFRAITKKQHLYKILSSNNVTLEKSFKDKARHLKSMTKPQLALFFQEVENLLTK